MDRHATLWLSEACGGTRLGACGRCVAARCAGGERQRSNRRTLSTLSTRDGSLTLAPWCLVLGCHRLRLGGDGTSCVAGQPATTSGVAIIYVSSSSGYVADTPVGSIPGYAQLPPPPGWRITSPLVIISVKARAAAMHFRVIRLIRVLDCFTRHCLCTAMRDSRVPLTGCDLKWENHRTRSARAACLVSMVCAEDCTFWVMKWCFSAKREGFLACFFFLVL